MFLGVELGLAVSIGVSLLTVVLEAAFPHTAMLGHIEKTTTYRWVAARQAACDRVPTGTAWLVSRGCLCHASAALNL